MSAYVDVVVELHEKPLFHPSRALVARSGGRTGPESLTSCNKQDARSRSLLCRA